MSLRSKASERASTALLPDHHPSSFSVLLLRFLLSLSRRKPTQLDPRIEQRGKEAPMTPAARTNWFMVLLVSASMGVVACGQDAPSSARPRDAAAGGAAGGSSGGNSGEVGGSGAARAAPVRAAQPAAEVPRAARAVAREASAAVPAREVRAAGADRVDPRRPMADRAVPADRLAARAVRAAPVARAEAAMRPPISPSRMAARRIASTRPRTWLGEIHPARPTWREPMRPVRTGRRCVAPLASTSPRPLTVADAPSSAARTRPASPARVWKAAAPAATVARATLPAT